MADIDFISVIVGIAVLVGVMVVFKYKVLPKFRGFQTTILTIEERAGGNLFGMWNYGRRVISGEAGEEHSYELKKGKEKIKPMKLGYLLPTDKGDLWLTFSTSAGDMKPVDIVKNQITAINEDNRKWFTTTVKRIYDIYKPKSFMDKYGMWIMLIILILVVMGSNMMTVQKMGELQTTIDNDMKSITGGLQGVADNLKGLLNGIQIATGQKSDVPPG